MAPGERTNPDRDRILRLLAAEKARLAGSYLVRDLAIFGSYARGDQRPASDLDILVEVDSSIGLGFVELADHLEKTLGLRVDLVSSRALKPRMREAIQRDLIHV
jgi:hypothetical protein